MELRDFFRFYRGLPHQDAAIKQLQDAMPAALLTRDADWYQTWQAGGKQEDLNQALQLIKEFEGCQLKAYPDPLSGGDPWTIGYGTTRINGKPVPHDLTITQAKADQLLEAEVRELSNHLAKTIPHWGEMTSNQRCALVSFAYNLGADFYNSSGFETISHVIYHKLWDQMRDALLLYRNPGSNVEAGLRRRREAEVKLWGGNTSKPDRVELVVPYEYQNDNKSGTGYRECFSSSCAMVAKFYGKVASDDAYNIIRARYGDTTDSQAQVKALRSLGLNARFVTNAGPINLEVEICAGRPVAVGWLHKGPLAAPTGGGHWSVVTGFNPSHWIVNDPNGEADLVNGGYTKNTNGKNQRYSRTAFNRRWMPDGINTGWALLIQLA
jgi:GH24 family phage-related lysozyme (muramidase)